MSENILKITDLKKSFIAGDGNLPILKGVSLELNTGDSIAITGPSGCGKSTLLNIIGTLEEADSGTVSVNGIDIAGLSEKEKAALRLKQIGFVFQKHHLLPQLTAMENILLPTLKDPSPNAEEYASELLEKVGLKERSSHRPGQLSGGECQRVALCRALINKPVLLLADEPTGALDAESTKMLSGLLTQLNKQESLTILAVTHSAEFAASMGANYKLVNGVLEKA